MNLNEKQIATLNNLFNGISEEDRKNIFQMIDNSLNGVEGDNADAIRHTALMCLTIVLPGIKQEIRLRGSEEESLKQAASEAGTIRREAMKSIMASQDSMMQAEIKVSGVEASFLKL